MATTLRHIIAYLSVALIVVTTGGIGLVQHYCSCEGDAHLMVAARTAGTFHGEEEGMCCQATDPADAEASCCATPEPQKTDRHGHHCQAGDDCCSEHYSYFKTDQFNLSGSTADLLKYSPGKAADLLDPCMEEPADVSLLTQVSDRSPPGLFGRSLLIRLHQLKTEPLIS